MDNKLILRIHIPVWDIDENEQFEIEGKEPSEVMNFISGFDRDEEKVIWDIDVIEGKVLNWNGEKVHLFDKICDGGTYELIYDGEVVDSVENDCVPDFLCIGDDGYGDYIGLDINPDGTIKDWGEEQQNGIYTYFHIMDATQIEIRGGFINWYERELDHLRYYNEGEDLQLITPTSLILSKNGKLIKMVDYINEFLNN
jgi:hypothetical protein